MPILPDILGPGLDVVFCGTAVGEMSAARGHYFAGRGNKFWSYLDESRLTPRLLTPEEDHLLPDFGLGLTDLVKEFAQSHDRGLDFSDAPNLEMRLRPYQPRWVAFVGLNAATKASRVFKQPPPRHGAQSWTVGKSKVFVVTNPSGANASGPWDGRPEKVDWWHDLARSIKLHDS